MLARASAVPCPTACVCKVDFVLLLPQDGQLLMLPMIDHQHNLVAIDSIIFSIPLPTVYMVLGKTTLSLHTLSHEVSKREVKVAQSC